MHIEADTSGLSASLSNAVKSIQGIEAAASKLSTTLSSSGSGAKSLNETASAANSAGASIKNYSSAASESALIQQALYARQRSMSQEWLAQDAATTAANASLKQLAQTQAAAQASTQVATKAALDYEGALRGMSNTLNIVGFAATAAFGMMAKSGIEMAGNLERTEVAFTRLFGSNTLAKDMMGQLQELARTTPFDLDNITQGALKLKAAGFETEKIIPMLRSLGDAVAGSGRGVPEMQKVILALSQIQGKGRLMGQEMNQLTETTTFSWKDLAAYLGVSVPKAFEMVQGRSVSAATAIQAYFAHAQDAFGGMMAAQAKTWVGELETFKDTVNLRLAYVFDPTKMGLTGLLDAFNYTTPAVQDFIVEMTAGGLATVMLGTAAAKTAMFVADLANNLGYSSVSAVGLIKNFGILAVGVAGLILLVGALSIGWQAVSDTAMPVISEIWGAIKDFVAKVAGVINPLMTFIRDEWLDLGESMIHTAWTVAEAFDEVFGTHLSDSIYEAYMSFLDFKDEAQSTDWAGNVSAIADGLGEIQSGVAHGVVDGITDSFVAGVSTFGKAVNAVLGDLYAPSGSVSAGTFVGPDAPLTFPDMGSPGSGKKTDAEKAWDKFNKTWNKQLDSQIADLQIEGGNWELFNAQWGSALKTKVTDIRTIDDEWNDFSKAWDKTLKTSADDITVLDGTFGQYFKHAAAAMGDVLMNSVDGASQIMQAGQAGMATGGPVGAVVGVGIALLAQSEQFGAVMDSVSAVLQNFADLIGAILGPLLGLLNSLMQWEAKVLKSLGDWVSGAFDKLFHGKDGLSKKEEEAQARAEAAAKQWEEMTAKLADSEGQDWVDEWTAKIEAATSPLEEMSLKMQMLADAATHASETLSTYTLSMIKAEAQAAYDAVVAAGGTASELTGVTRMHSEGGTSQAEEDAYMQAFNELVSAADETADSFEELNDALTNIPDGFKAAYETWKAMDTEAIYNSAAVGTAPGGGATGDASIDFGGSAGAMTFDPSSIPHLAAGGLAASPTIALIGEAGPEAIIPLDQMASLMGGGGGGVSFSGCEFNIAANDPEAFMAALGEEVRRRNMSTGGTGYSRRSAGTYRKPGGG